MYFSQVGKHTQVEAMQRNIAYMHHNASRYISIYYRRLVAVVMVRMISILNLNHITGITIYRYNQLEDDRNQVHHGS